MKVPEPDEETPLAWKAILAYTPVFSSEGDEVGVVEEVLGSEAEDIFHGVVVRSGLIAHEVMVPAAEVTVISNKRVNVSMSDEQIRSLPAYEPEHSYQLGFVGLLRKHLGWTDEENRAP